MAGTGGPEEPDVIARTFVLLVGADSLESFLGELAGLAADEVDRELSCGISIRLADRPMSVASSDALAEELDDAQYSAGEGPGLDAIDTRRPVEMPDIDAGERWPIWRARARANGVRKAFAVPLTAVDTTLGALNTYSTSPEPFTEADRDAAEKFADKAAHALAVATRLSESAEVARVLETALTARGTIDQATGILMARERCTPDEALELLKTSAQRQGVRVLDIAENLVTDAAAPPGNPGPDSAG